MELKPAQNEREKRRKTKWRILRGRNTTRKEAKLSRKKLRILAGFLRGKLNGLWTNCSHKRKIFSKSPYLSMGQLPLPSLDSVAIQKFLKKTKIKEVF